MKITGKSLSQYQHQHHQHHRKRVKPWVTALKSQIQVSLPNSTPVSHSNKTPSSINMEKKEKSLSHYKHRTHRRSKTKEHLETSETISSYWKPSLEKKFYFTKKFRKTVTPPSPRGFTKLFFFFLVIFGKIFLGEAIKGCKKRPTCFIWVSKLWKKPF